MIERVRKSKGGGGGGGAGETGCRKCKRVNQPKVRKREGKEKRREAQREG